MIKRILALSSVFAFIAPVIASIALGSILYTGTLNTLHGIGGHAVLIVCCIGAVYLVWRGGMGCIFDFLDAVCTYKGYPPIE